MRLSDFDDKGKREQFFEYIAKHPDESIKKDFNKGISSAAEFSELLDKGKKVEVNLDRLIEESYLYE